MICNMPAVGRIVSGESIANPNQDTISRDNAKALTDNPRSKPAGWLKSGMTFERRDQLRSVAAFAVQIVPLDLEMHPASEPLEATLLNFSTDGACLEHRMPIAEPYVMIRWHDNAERLHEAILRLKWCRAIAANSFLSGGRVVGMS